jgi:hypothetical protein
MEYRSLTCMSILLYMSHETDMHDDLKAEAHRKRHVYF